MLMVDNDPEMKIGATTVNPKNVPALKGRKRVAQYVERAWAQLVRTGSLVSAG